jgi:Ca2+-dependent lipid-binding protein
MNIYVRDDDITSSDLVGSTVIKISSLCANGGIDEWFKL